MKKIGAVTIAQSPRTDITADAPRFFQGQTEILEFGCLDRYSLQEAMALRPLPGDYVLTSRLRNGTEVRFSRGIILDQLQAGIRQLEERGVELILLFCTGELGELHASVPLLEPNLLLRALVPLMTRRERIILIPPSQAQAEQSVRRWSAHMPQFSFIPFPASPYQPAPITQELADQINRVPDADLVVMDCLGFSCEMGEALRKKTDKHVILPRTLLFQTAGALLGIQPPPQ